MSPATVEMRSTRAPLEAPKMFQKLLAVTLAVLLVGHVFFRPQLRRLGHRIDRLVTFMAIAVLLTWIGQVLFLVISRR